VKHRLVRLLQKYLVNPPVKAAFALGIVPSSHVLLETVGRTTGKPRRNPVGNGLGPDGRTLWVVAEHGRQAGYVKNIAANPRVRVKFGRHWRSGTAEILPDDDPRARLDAIGRGVKGAVVRAMGTDLLTVRIVLDPHGASEGGAMPAGPEPPE
jgi:deazaflavin-dependent oxidoreductase (nitroreductase family)